MASKTFEKCFHASDQHPITQVKRNIFPDICRKLNWKKKGRGGGGEKERERERESESERGERKNTFYENV